MGVSTLVALTVGTAAAVAAAAAAVAPGLATKKATAATTAPGVLPERAADGNASRSSLSHPIVAQEIHIGRVAFTQAVAAELLAGRCGRGIKARSGRRMLTKHTIPLDP